MRRRMPRQPKVGACRIGRCADALAQPLTRGGQVYAPGFITLNLVDASHHQTPALLAKSRVGLTCGLLRGYLVKCNWRLDERSMATSALDDINPYQRIYVQRA